MIDALCRALQYTFNDKKWLQLALTHRSYNNNNNERLEFLGDSIVNCVIAEALYHRYSYAQEGELSRWRATLINRDTLGILARQFDVGRYLFLGPGELKSGGSERLSILSCAMEAIIGAIYLDGGFEVVREVILRWYEPLLDQFAKATSHKDPKTTLQEFLQSKQMALPIYTVDSTEGEAHQQTFIVSCAIEGVRHKTLGKGTSRRRAEQDAAESMLDILRKPHGVFNK